MKIRFKSGFFYANISYMDMWKALLFYFTLFILIFAICTNSIHYDYDLWARLIAGMGVIDGGGVLKSDFLSYTPVHTWYDHEWGSGVVFYLFLKLFGPFSLIVLESILYFGIFFTISKIIKLRTNNPPYNIIFYIFPIIAVAQNFNNPVRCHLFTFLLFTVFLYILELARKGQNRPLYIIPILTIIWNNLHGGVVAGLGLIVLYIIGEFLNRKPIKKYILTFCISAPLLIINPWGYDYIKFLLIANTMKRPEVAEWWGIFAKINIFSFIPFKLFMAAIIGIEFITLIKNKTDKLIDWWNNLDKTKYIILISTLYLGFTRVKLLPFFVITGTIFGYEDFYKLISKIEFPQWKNRVLYTVLLSMTIFSLIIKNISIPVNFDAYPVKEVEFVKINNLKGKILVNFGLGSYVAYKLYPNNLIYMDGRYEEVYYEGMVPLLKKFYLVMPYWNEVLVKYPPDLMILENDYPVYRVLKDSKTWSNVYEGKRFGVFVKKDQAKANYKMPTNDKEYYKDTLFDTDIKFKKRV